MDAKINSFTTEAYYYLSPYTQYTGADIEDATKYDGLLRYLVVRLVCYWLLMRKVVENVAGTAGQAPTGAQQITKAQADVVEVEFEYSTAKDGNTLITTTDAILAEVKLELCNYGSLLKYYLPMCDNGCEYALPFKVYPNCE